MNTVEDIDFNFYAEHPDAPVIITEQEVKLSEANRGRKPRTIRQLPVFRDSCNLAFLVDQIMVKCPRNCKSLIDETERIVTRLLQSLDLANEDKQNRQMFCAEAHSSIVALTVKLEILQRLGVINKDTLKKAKRMCQSVTAQVTGWGRSASNEGFIQK